MEEATATTTPEFFIATEIYIPKEYAYIDYERSWKKCKCGRITGLRDNWCPTCGQRLGRPPIDD